MKPDQFTISEKMLPVGDGHELYVQVWGNPKAKMTVVHLHGGPGSGTSDSNKQYYDPAVHRVVFYDQRGAGNSTPHGLLGHNTTDELVDDITKIMDDLGCEKFALAGGSWGTTLALVYAIRNPQKVQKMVLRAIYCGTREESDSLEKGPWRIFFPDVWDTFVASAPAEHAADPAAYHIQQMKQGNAGQIKNSSYAYANMEYALCCLDDRFKPTPYEEYDEASKAIETAYISQGCFLPENYIMDNATKLIMPIHLVQGRYDMVCPPVTAYNLHQKLPNSQLYLTIAGHSGYDRANFELFRALFLQPL